MPFWLPFLKGSCSPLPAHRATILALCAGFLLFAAFPLHAEDQVADEDDFFSWFFSSEGEEREVFDHGEADKAKSFKNLSDVYQWLFGIKNEEEGELPSAPVLQPTPLTDSGTEKMPPGDQAPVIVPGYTVWDHIADNTDWRAYRLPSRRREKFDLYLWFITDLLILRMEIYWRLKQAQTGKTLND